MLRILATADIHSPRYLSMFMKSMRDFREEVDLIVLAGDLVDKNNVVALKPIYNYLMERFNDKPIIAVYGNEEYRGFEEKYRELYGGFKWLNDEYLIVETNGLRIGIIGTRGALDKPTSWQARNIPGISTYYRELPLKISKMVEEVRDMGVDIVILVSHYGVTYKNLVDEPRYIWVHLASRRFEELIPRMGLDLVIHGHIHRGVDELVYLDGIPVYNVSLPARGRVVYIKFEETIMSKKSRVSGLDKWFKT